MNSKSLRYWGEFTSKSGTQWRVELWQEAETPWPISRMTFPYGTPLEIEWSSTDKIEPLQPSHATLTVVSDTDRQYIDLFTLEPRSVILKVFRDYMHNTLISAEPAPSEYLYWSGSLDTELYEEPFAEKKNYEVSLVFSDFAVLERLSWSNTKTLISVQEALDECLEATEVSVIPANDDSGKSRFITKEFISTKMPDPEDHLELQDINLDQLFLQTSNFFDEKEDPLNLREVLEGILQPFALRIIQKQGRFILYDLNALYNSDLELKELRWAGTDALLNTDKIYNNVTINFSPYIKKDLLAPKIEAEEDKSREHTVYLNYIHKGMGNGGGESIPGFKFYYTDKGKGVTANYFCKFSPLYSGTEATGILYFCRLGQDPSYEKYMNLSYIPSHEVLPPKKMNNFRDSHTSGEVFRLPPVYLPIQTNRDVQKELVLSVDLLFDARYNPFEPASNTNEYNSYKTIEEDFNFIYIPGQLVLKNKEGAITHYFNNQEVVSGKYNGKTRGSWKQGDPGNTSYFYLAYYNPSNLGHSSGVHGWKKNRQAIGWYNSSLPQIYSKMGQGEHIPLPPVAGDLEFWVYPGAVIRDEKGHDNANVDLIRWFCFKDPKIQLSNLDGTSVEEKDINDVAWLNKSATEKLEIDTIVGTLPIKDYSCMARGTIMDSRGIVIQRFSRVEEIERLERLLIGTIFSQYASRHNILSGTAELLPEFSLLSEGSSDHKKFILLNEIQNIMEEESTIKMVELSPEVYHPSILI